MKRERLTRGTLLLGGILILLMSGYGLSTLLAVDGPLIGSVGKIIKGRGEIVVKSKKAGQTIRMGDKMYVRIDGKVAVMEAIFPMQSIAKCRLLPKYRSFLKRLKPNMPVYKYLPAVEEGAPAVPAEDLTPGMVVGEGVPGEVRRIGEMDFVFIKGGTYTMGMPESPDRVYAGETPQHSVTVSSFWMGKFEVTQKQFQEIMGYNPSRFIGENNPVDSVNWYMAEDFCKKFSAKYKVKARLPYEAEWEYAARGGTQTKYYWGDTLNPDYCWFSGNSGGTTHPVGEKKPNNYGLYDMSGNVYEWCIDWYLKEYYAQSPAVDPRGPEAGTQKFVRGGSIVSVDFHPSPLRVDVKVPVVPVSKQEGWGIMGLRVIIVP